MCMFFTGLEIVFQTDADSQALEARSWRFAAGHSCLVVSGSHGRRLWVGAIGRNRHATIVHRTWRA